MSLEDQLQKWSHSSRGTCKQLLFHRIQFFNLFHLCYLCYLVVTNKCLQNLFCPSICWLDLISGWLIIFFSSDWFCLSLNSCLYNRRFACNLYNWHLSWINFFNRCGVWLFFDFWITDTNKYSNANRDSIKYTFWEFYNCYKNRCQETLQSM